MKYFVCSGYYILNVNGKNYVVDETSERSFVLRKEKIELNGAKPLRRSLQQRKRYFEALIRSSDRRLYLPRHYPRRRRNQKWKTALLSSGSSVA